MLASLLVLADGITVKLGNNVFTIGVDLILYLIIAAIVGYVAERIVRSSVPFGIVGSIIVALIGIWLMTRVLIINGIPDITVLGVPLIRALIGAILLVLIWRAITYRRVTRRAL
jgi:uncharacterized membrane protein YeaQ/YmgE (transglycosylase-associated protein family)